jgi:hypothetical protein
LFFSAPEAPAIRKLFPEAALTAVLSGFTGVIARISGCKWDFLVRLFQEIFDHWDHPLLFPKQGEMAGIRDHGELGVGDELQGLKDMFKAHKIVISEGD